MDLRKEAQATFACTLVHIQWIPTYNTSTRSSKFKTSVPMTHWTA